MKIVYISVEDVIGRRFNGYDLCQSLNTAGNNCRMYVSIKSSRADYIYPLFSSHLMKKCLRSVTYIESKLSLKNMFYPPNISFKRFIRTAEIIHLHLISSGYISFWEIFLLSLKKPIIITLHDFSLFTGHCTNPPYECEKWKQGCHSCNYLNRLFPLRRDRTSIIWRYNSFIWKRVKPTVIVSSTWMLDKVKSSSIFSDCSINIIPFGLDVDLFIPGDKHSAKKSLGIADDAFVIMFRALNSEFKGLDTIREALKILKVSRPICLLTLNGVGELNQFKDRYQIIEIEIIRDEKGMVTLFQASDLFLMPSTQETFGMMAIEAMACGVPSIISTGTPLVEVTRSPEGAIAISPNDPEILSNTISQLILDESLRDKIGKRARNLAVELYDFKLHVNRVYKLYQGIINNTHFSDISD